MEPKVCLMVGIIGLIMGGSIGAYIALWYKIEMNRVVDAISDFSCDYIDRQLQREKQKLNKIYEQSSKNSNNNRSDNWDQDSVNDKL